MNYSIFCTDFGEVRISNREEQILRLAGDVRRELRGSPFLDEPAAQRLLGKADAIEHACKNFAMHRAFA